MTIQLLELVVYVVASVVCAAVLVAACMVSSGISQERGE